MKTINLPFDPIKRLLARLTGNSRSGPFAELGAWEIRIILRGEQLLYRDQRGAVVVEISLPGRWISEQSIDKWDGERPVSMQERCQIIERIKTYFRERQGFEVSTIR